MTTFLSVLKIQWHTILTVSGVVLTVIRMTTFLSAGPCTQDWMSTRLTAKWLLINLQSCRGNMVWNTRKGLCYFSIGWQERSRNGKLPSTPTKIFHKWQVTLVFITVRSHEMRARASWNLPQVSSAVISFILKQTGSYCSPYHRQIFQWKWPRYVTGRPRVLSLGPAAFGTCPVSTRWIWPGNESWKEWSRYKASPRKHLIASTHRSTLNN